MTPREYQEFENEKTLAEMQIDYNLKVKAMELEVAKIEAKWTVLYKIPLMIIKLPVAILFGIAVIFSTVTKVELPQQFWDYLKK